MTASAPALSIAVIQGGPSAEAEVSRASARAIAGALEAAGHRVVRHELDAYLADSLRTGGFDVVFPASHGAVGEDGALQGLLEVLELPYVGSGVLASALAMDKPAANVMFAAAGLPIAAGVVLDRATSKDALAGAERALAALGERIVVKPRAGGSAIGVARFAEGASAVELARAIEEVWSRDDAALVERFAAGREVTCGVLDPFGEPSGARALPLIEILSPRDPFYTYEARYAPGRSKHVCPASLTPDVAVRVREVALGAHRALGCRDLCRVDLLVGDGPEGIVLLEVNTMPGFTATSLFPEAAAASGLSMNELCHALALGAFRRGGTPRSAAIPLPR